MKKVNTLYRVSTKGQVDKLTDDIPMQRLACQEFARNHGWVITKEYEEKGISGFKVSARDRDAIQELKEATKKKQFDILLVFMFDRIGRIDDETPFVVEWFVKHGIEVWSVKEGEQRFDNHVDKLTNYIRFWQASGESEKTSMRIKTRMQQLTLEGCYTGGPLPFGYKLVDKGRINKKGNVIPDVAIEPFEAEIIREIYWKTINDGLGSYRLASYLNEKGLQTHSGSNFTSSTVNRILRNPRYCGYLKNGNATSDIYLDLSIIDRETFAQAQRILDQRGETDSTKRHISLNTKSKIMLSGNVFCAHCGGTMVAWRYQDRYKRTDGTECLVDEMKYLCYHRSRKINECNGQATYKADRVDELVSDVMCQLFSVMKGAPSREILKSKFDKKFKNTNAIWYKLQGEHETSKRQLEKLQHEIAKALTGESLYSPSDLKVALASARQTVDDIEKQLGDFESDSKKQKNLASSIFLEYNQFKSWSEEFETASVEQKKMIACQLFSRIELEKGYKLHFTLNMSYQQFIDEWNDALPEEQMRVAE